MTCHIVFGLLDLPKLTCHIVFGLLDPWILTGTAHSKTAILVQNVTVSCDAIGNGLRPISFHQSPWP